MRDARRGGCGGCERLSRVWRGLVERGVVRGGECNRLVMRGGAAMVRLEMNGPTAETEGTCHGGAGGAGIFVVETGCVLIV